MQYEIEQKRCQSPPPSYPPVRESENSGKEDERANQNRNKINNE